MRIGIDIDGVLANFEIGFHDKLIQATGKDLVPADWMESSDPPVWDWPQLAGYDNWEVSAAWELVKRDDRFWQNLKAFPDVWKVGLYCEHPDHDLYFITNRMGINAKRQTEQWIRNHTGTRRTTVLLAADKGAAAKALDLDCYIDDKDSNVLAVLDGNPKTRVYLRTRRYNADLPQDPERGNPENKARFRPGGDFIRVSGIMEFMEKEGLVKTLKAETNAVEVVQQV